MCVGNQLSQGHLFWMRFLMLIYPPRLELLRRFYKKNLTIKYKLNTMKYDLKMAENAVSFYFLYWKVRGYRGSQDHLGKFGRD